MSTPSPKIYVSTMFRDMVPSHAWWRAAVTDGTGANLRRLHSSLRRGVVELKIEWWSLKQIGSMNSAIPAIPAINLWWFSMIFNDFPVGSFNLWRNGSVHPPPPGCASTSWGASVNKHGGFYQQTSVFFPQNKYGFSQDKWANLLTKWEFKQLTKNV